MITYDRLWATMKEKGVTQYDLYTHYNINRSQLNRLRHNMNVEVNTIDRLCNILHCRILWSILMTAISFEKRILPENACHT